MVYVFKKINDMVGGSSPSGGQVISQGAGANPNSPTDAQNPYASTYRNPDKIYQANLGENQGNVDTGLSKSLQDTQNNLTQSTNNYKSNLDSINSQYNYNGTSDLDNIGDSATFSRLSRLVNPTSAQTSLSGVQSNTANFNPDTSGVAASSTVDGLSNQLRNQYGTSAGGARLDAQLYRGSGQAGAAINNNLKQIDDFRADKQNQLSNESNILNQYEQGITNKSNILKSDAQNYQNNLLTQAQKQAANVQNNYDTTYQNSINDLNNYKASLPYQQQLKDSIFNIVNERSKTTPLYTQLPDNSAAQEALRQQFGYTPEEFNKNITSETIDQGDSGTISKQNLNIAPYLANQLFQSALPNINLDKFKPENYVSAAPSVSENMYLDPKFNSISQLLGLNQRAIETPTSSNIVSQNDKYKSDINNYLAQQQQQATAAANNLFNSDTSDTLDPYTASYRQFARISPALSSVFLGAGLPWMGTGASIGGFKLPW